MITRHLAFNTFAALCISATAHAQTATPQNSPSSPNKLTEARDIYVRARTAENQGDFDKACPMYETALALVPDYQKAAIATAKCYEKAGKYYTALNRYEKAQQVAANQAVQDPIMLELIRKGIAFSTDRISYVTIYVPGSVGSIAGVSVTLNGEIVVPSMYGTQIPLDRGSYVIVTAAPGRISRKIEFEVTGDAQDFQRTLVPLKIDPNASAPPNTAKTEPKIAPAQDQKPVVNTPTGTKPEPKPTTTINRRDPSSNTGAGITLIVLSAGVLTGAAFLTKQTVETPSSNTDYSMYFGLAAAGYLMGTFGVIGGATLAMSSRKTPNKETAFLQTSTLFIGPGQISFQARW